MTSYTNMKETLERASMETLDLVVQGPLLCDFYLGENGKFLLYTPHEEIEGSFSKTLEVVGRRKINEPRLACKILHNPDRAIYQVAFSNDVETMKFGTRHVSNRLKGSREGKSAFKEEADISKLLLLQSRYAASNRIFIWRNSPKTLVLLDVNTLNVAARFDNFWATGYHPRLVCCNESGSYVVGLSSSHRNSMVSLGWKDEFTGEPLVKKVELSSKEKWVGMDLNCRETGLVVCSIIDTKGARLKKMNPEIYPTTLVFSLFNHRSPSFQVIESQEFFDNRFQQANVMRRFSSADVFSVGSYGIVGFFSLDATNKFTLLTTVSSFGEYLVTDIFLEVGMLVIIREDPELDYPIAFYDLQTLKPRDDSLIMEVPKKPRLSLKSEFIKTMQETYLQPNIKLHALQKFKEEIKEEGSFIASLLSSEGVTVAVGNTKGICFLVEKETGLSEAALSSSSRLFSQDIDLIGMQLLDTGSLLVQLKDSHDLVILDKSAKKVKTFKNEARPTNESQKLSRLA